MAVIIAYNHYSVGVNTRTTISFHYWIKIMLNSTEPNEERTETLNELSDLLFVVQEMGRRLAL